MPCGYHLNLDDGLVTIRGTDQVPLRALISVGEAVLADPAFDPQIPQLIDLRGVEVIEIETAARVLRSFATETYRPQVHASIAVVIDGQLSERATAGLYHLACSLDKTELFDQYDHALKWLMRREFI